MGEGERAELRRRTERWFVHQGLPHFITGYRATTDVWTRAVPFLTVVFVAELFFTFDEDREGWREVLPFLAGLAIVTVAVVAVNRLRGRRPLQRPDRIGTPELALFVLVPALLPALFSKDHVTDAGAAIALNLTILALTYLVTSYGVVPMTRWALGRTAEQVGNVADLMVRSLPLLLLFATVLFINAEIWQVGSDFEAPFFLLSLGMLFLAGTAFLILRQERELAAVSTFATWDEAREAAGSAPVAEVPVDELAGVPDPPPLDRRERVNLSMVLVFGQGLQILLVATAIGLFYVLFGLVAIREATMTAWVGDGLDPIGALQLFGNEVLLTWDLVRVAILIAALSAVQLTFSSLTDQTYREEFLEGMLAEVREALAARAIYGAGLVDPPPEG